MCVCLRWYSVAAAFVAVVDVVVVVFVDNDDENDDVENGDDGGGVHLLVLSYIYCYKYPFYSAVTMTYELYEYNDLML